MGTRIIVEDCTRRLVPQQLMRRGLTRGTWANHYWTIQLSEHGSWLQLDGAADKTWELVPIIRTGAVSGVWWLIQDHTGRRCTCLMMSPDGTRIGTRWELRGRFRSQRLWGDRKKRAHQRAKAISKLGMKMSIEWCVEHPDYVAKKPKLMRQATYKRLREKLLRYGEPKPVLP